MSKKELLPGDVTWKIKKDEFQRARGNPELLSISCASCLTLLLIYQKDGPGSLLRCYLDRIAWPEKYQRLLKTNPTIQDLSPIACSCCGQLIGHPTIYAKENRLAFNLVRGAFSKAKRS